MTDDGTVATLETAGDESYVDLMGVEETNPISFSLRPKNNTIGVDSNVQTTQICATMKAQNLPDEISRAPVDILVCLDISSSMSGSKLKLCKETLRLLLRVLHTDDRFGLICYSNDATIAFPMKFMTSENKSGVQRKLDSMDANGCTNISAAITLAFQELRAVEHPNAVRSIFLLTDGHANTGISNQHDLVELTRNCASSLDVTSSLDEAEQKPQRGMFGSFLGGHGNRDIKAKHTVKDVSLSPIALFCFGYGTDHNASMLRELTDATDSGSYYFVKDDSDVGSAFGDAMGGVLSVVAQSAVLTVKVPVEATGVSITHIYHDRAIQRENGAYAVNVGDFYAEESRDVLIEVTLASNRSGDVTPIPHLSVSLAYTDVLAKKPLQAGPLLCSISRPTGNEVSTDDNHVVAQWLRVLATHEMKAAEEFAKQGDLEQARHRIDVAAMQIASAPKAVSGMSMVEQLTADLDQASANMQSFSVYHEQGRHYLEFKGQTYRNQRCSESTAFGANTFRSPRKEAMQSRFTLPPKK